MKYTIGLDLGTTSVGWAVINEDKKRITDLGVRYFDKPENPKNGSSLAEPRRLARSQRRRLARRNGRLDATKKAFIDAGLTSDQISKTHQLPNNPYEIRARALDTVVSLEELFVAVYHIVKRRGYKSNRKKIVEKEEGPVLEGVKQSQEALKKAGSRTIGELLYKELKEAGIAFGGIRNKVGSYKRSVTRQMLEDELRYIFTAQKKLGSAFVSDNLILAIVGTDESGKEIGAFNRQKHYATGELLKSMVGRCAFEKSEIRASKATYAFQYSNALQKVNHITIKEGQYGEGRFLTDEQKKIAIEYILNTRTVHYSGLRKKLKLANSDRFNMVNYQIVIKKDEEVDREELLKDVEKKTKLPSMKVWQDLKKLFEKTDTKFAKIAIDDTRIFDEIAMVLTMYRTDEDVLKNLKKIKIDDNSLDIPKDVQDALLGVSYSTFGSLSLKSLYKIIPFLEKGMQYVEAVSEAGYKEFANIKGYKLKPIPKDNHSITNPVVKRTVSQTIKVVNAIIDKYGSPYSINIEFGRDLSKNFKERNSIKKRQEENAETNNKAKLHMRELGIQEPKGQDIIKFKLWKEQDCKCGYSGRAIDESRLNEDGYVEIDHIIPFSRSFDDSFSNKVLVLKQENQEKCDKTPYEFFGGNEQKWSDYEARVGSLKNISPTKRSKLLTKKYVGDDIKARQLNDSRYIARFVKNYIEKGLEFSNPKNRRPVLTVNGTATAYVRKRWTLHKDRQKNTRHHAQDAAIVAMMNASMIQKISLDAKYGEVREYLSLHKGVQKDITDDELQSVYKEIEENDYRKKKYFVEPWEGFRYELAARMSDDPFYELEAYKDKIPWFKNREDDVVRSDTKPIFVSRMPRRGVRGKAHDDTVRSPKRFNQEVSSVKTPITSLTEKNLTEGGKFLDPNLVKGLIRRLRDFDDNGEKAFAEPFYKTMKNGEKGPLVRSVKLVNTSQKSGVLINDGKGLVDRQSMIRVDVFHRIDEKGKGEYYCVPIYAHHKTEKNLPDEAFPSGKKMNKFTVFQFSLYPGDLIKYQKKGGEEHFGYYTSMDIDSARFNILPHDQSARENGLRLPTKTLDKLDKYVVDILGNIHKVNKENRQSLN